MNTKERAKLQEALVAAELALIPVPELLKLAADQLHTILADWSDDELREAYELIQWEDDTTETTRIH
jgi:hypothetical protein